MNKLILLFIAITFIVNSSDANEFWQKSENYGYYNNTKTTTPVSTATVATETKNNIPQKNTVVNNNVANNTEVNNIADNDTAANEKQREEQTNAALKMDHSAFNTLLQSYVNSKGLVDYKGMKSKLGELTAYTDKLSNNVPDVKATDNEKLAFWINAYNANTIKLILENYPVKSINDIAGGKPFDKKFITIGGESLSLNDIENNKIRKQFDEPRIHFAVNCAAQSCPPLWNQAWTADNLKSTLEKRAKSFINNSNYNQLSTNKAAISKIFEWYAKDFPSDIISYINRYSNNQVSSGTKVTYKDYDWALNEQ